MYMNIQYLSDIYFELIKNWWINEKKSNNVSLLDSKIWADIFKDGK